MLDKELVTGQKHLSKQQDLDGFIDCLERAREVAEEHEELQSCISKLLAGGTSDN